jgi:hypothetical protein
MDSTINNPKPTTTRTRSTARPISIKGRDEFLALADSCLVKRLVGLANIYLVLASRNKETASPNQLAAIAFIEGRRAFENEDFQDAYRQFNRALGIWSQLGSDAWPEWKRTATFHLARLEAGWLQHLARRSIKDYLRTEPRRSRRARVRFVALFGHFGLRIDRALFGS